MPVPVLDLAAYLFAVFIFNFVRKLSQSSENELLFMSVAIVSAIATFRCSQYRSQDPEMEMKKGDKSPN